MGRGLSYVELILRGAINTAYQSRGLRYMIPFWFLLQLHIGWVDWMNFSKRLRTTNRLCKRDLIFNRGILCAIAMDGVEIRYGVYLRVV